jgi:hypothetical protein
MFLSRNEYQQYFLVSKVGRYLGLTNLPPSCAHCLEIWEPQPSRPFQACNGIAFYICPRAFLESFNPYPANVENMVSS